MNKFDISEINKICQCVSNKNMKNEFYQHPKNEAVNTNILIF